jgi:peptide/nickel transport system substrate-binding protein
MASLSMSAHAQKSEDRVKIGVFLPFPTVDSYLEPSNAYLSSWTGDIYGRLVRYNEHKQEMFGELAKGWKRVDDKTLEFDLRDDIVFSSGNKFTANDVKYTLEWLTNPETKIRFQTRYTWIDRVEVLSPTKLRIHAKYPRTDVFELLAYLMNIYDAQVHGPLDDKSLYGRRSASSTGAYKLVSIDHSGNFELTRNDQTVGKFAHMHAAAKNINGLALPDSQAQIAQLLVGGIHVASEVSADMAAQFANNPKFVVRPDPTNVLVYITPDAAGRSNNKLFTDKRIRQAFFMAIDREEIIKSFIPGAEIAIRPNAICFPTIVDCVPSPQTKPAGYDPAGAKKLLAEAGKPDGFDMVLTAFSPQKDIAEAIAGQLLKVGIRASVSAPLGPVFLKDRDDGKFHAQVSQYPFSVPGMTSAFELLFGDSRDYLKDPVITEAVTTGPSLMADAQRHALFRKALDRLNDEALVYPFSQKPNINILASGLNVQASKFSAVGTRLGDYVWR